MQSGETFRKLNNFADVPLVCDDGSVTIELALNFFIDILFYFQSLVHRDKQTRENKENGQFVKRRKLCGWQAARRSVKVEA